MFRDIGETIEYVAVNTFWFILLLAMVCVPVYLCVSIVTARNALEECTEQLAETQQRVVEMQLKLMEAHNERDSAIHELAELKRATK